MITTNADIINSLLILLKLALIILNNDFRMRMNIVIVQTNKILRFNSPFILAMSCTKNAAVNPINPNTNDVKNHFKNLSILNTYL